MKKIFGIGLSKTGTSSLNKALNILGHKTIHMPKDPHTYEQLMNGDFRLDILEEYEGLTDIVGAAFYPQFDEIYADSGFILTIRPKKQWLKSTEYFFKKEKEDYVKASQGNKTKKFGTGKFFCFHIGPEQYINWCVYKTNKFNENLFSSIYDLHIKNAIDYFKYKKNKILIFNIEDGWGPICEFLKKDIPKEKFPHLNINYKKLLL